MAFAVGVAVVVAVYCRGSYRGFPWIPVDSRGFPRNAAASVAEVTTEQAVETYVVLAWVAMASSTAVAMDITTACAMTTTVALAVETP